MQNSMIQSDLDIHMDGYVSWVGKSSMETTMTLSQKYGQEMR